MAKIIYDMKSCIGAGECENMSPELWKVSNDGRAVLDGAMHDPVSGKYELEIDDAVAARQERVAKSCPVGCIRVVR
jgi:ferredoxin